MPEVRQLLEREMRRISPPQFSVEDLLRRKERKDRRGRVAAALTVMALFGGSVLWLGLNWLGLNVEPDRGRGPVPASQPQVDPDARREFIRAVQAFCRPAFRDIAPFLPIGVEYSRENIRNIRGLVPVLLDHAAHIGALELPPGDEEAAHIVDRFQQMAEKAREALDATRAAPGQFELAARELRNFYGAAYLTLEHSGIRGCA